MAAHAKKARQLARQYFKLSVVDSAVSPDRVAGVLAHIEKHKPANPMMILKAYQQYITAELEKSRAVVEHAGEVGEATLTAIATALSKKYGRPVTTTAKSNPELLAGLRVHVGDDIYESSVAGQLAALAASV